MNARNKTADFKHNMIIGFFAELLLPYHWAYKKGKVDGMQQTNYFKGYGDGLQDGCNDTSDRLRKFFDDKDFRKTGKKKEGLE